MSARLLDLGLAKPVAVGLWWSVVDPTEAKAARRDVRGKAYATLTSGTTNEVAIGDDTDRVAAPGKALCGAALVASVAPTAFVYHSIGVADGGEELVWICGIQHGIPVPGFEDVVVVSEAREKYTTFASASDDVLLIGTLDEAKSSLQEILQRVEPKALRGAVLKASGLQIGHALAIMLAVVLAIVAVAGYFQLEDKRKRERLQWEEMVRRQAKSEAERKRLDDLRMAFEQKVATKREELAAQHDVAAAVNAWLEFLAHQVPVSYKGWVPLRASCRIEGCMIFWRPTTAALPIDGRRLPGTLHGWAANEVSTSFPLKLLPREVRTPADVEFQYRLLSMSSASSGQANVVQAPTPAPVVVSPPAELKDLKPVVLGTVGTFKASFTNLLALREFLNVLRPYAVEVEHFEATAFAPSIGSPGWSLEGRYIVRN